MPAVQIIPSDSASVFQVLNDLKVTRPDKVQAIIRPNNPPAGIAGYVFDIVGEESMELNSDITDHYVEDNTSIQDQISLKPEKFTVRGMVAELKMVEPLQAIQSPELNALPFFPVLSPVFTIGSEELQLSLAAGLAAQTNSIIETQSLFGYFNGNAGSIPQTAQGKAFAYFYQLWKGRQMFSVETPWGVMNSMAIESLSPTQGDVTRYRTDFAITFKKIRFAQAVTVNLGQLAGRAAQQQASTTQQAKATTTTATEPQKQSFIYQMGH